MAREPHTIGVRFTPKDAPPVDTGLVHEIDRTDDQRLVADLALSAEMESLARSLWKRLQPGRMR